jgi:hypothetical protein
LNSFIKLDPDKTNKNFVLKRLETTRLIPSAETNIQLYNLVGEPKSDELLDKILKEKLNDAPDLI